MSTVSCLEAALEHLAAGLCVLPAQLPEKIPILPSWKQFRYRLPSEEEVRRWFAAPRPMCIVTGESSGQLEILDFDAGGDRFEAWREIVDESLPDLVSRLPIERSPSGGFHLVYRVEGPVPGSKPLARREVEVPSAEPVTLFGKTYVPRERDGRFFVLLTLIETRGTGGLCMCHPSEGYVLQQGSFQQIPVLSQEQRDVLVEVARSLDELVPEPQTVTIPSEPCGRPGDDYNERGDLRVLLRRHGWVLVRGGDNEHWRRPGKTLGVSATLKNRVFYVFSSNAAPFEPNQAYRPFAVYALLEHGSDYRQAARSLRAQGFGGQPTQATGEVCLDGILQSLGGNAAGLAADGPKQADGPKHQPLSVRRLVESYPALRPPVVHNLLRQGETMNIIAAAKAGKSWLASDLAIAIATGRQWLDSFITLRGDVLIVDNELHPQTSAHRIPQVALARGVAPEEYESRVYVENLRGKLRDIHAMGAYFQAIEPGRYQAIVLDAFYRFLPRDTDENDNGAMANVYNQLDWIADRLGCAFVLIHHASKGNQSGKSVTDVGSGAGSQSRATDTHLVLRPHEEPDCVVLEAVVRSWPPLQPLCLRWKFPVWTPDSSLDPTALRQEHSRRRAKSASQPRELEMPTWDSRRFAAEFVTNQPQSMTFIVDAAVEAGLSVRKAEALLRRAEAGGLVHRWPLAGSRKGAYANVPLQAAVPSAESKQPPEPSKRDAVLALLGAEPELSNREIGRRSGASYELVRRLRTELSAGLTTA